MTDARIETFLADVLALEGESIGAIREGVHRYELSQLGIDVVLIQPGPYPTKLYTSIQKPSDTGRAASYGDLAKLPGGIEQFLHGVFTGPDAPDPHDVAQEIVTLINTRPGERPARVVTGLAFGADSANAAMAPFQAQLISGLGFDQLAKLAAA